MSWDKGIEKCKALGGDLASINSSDEQNGIYGKVYFLFVWKLPHTGGNAFHGIQRPWSNNIG